MSIKNKFEKYKVYFTTEAERDLVEIHNYIAQFNPMNAEMIVKRIRARTDTLDHFPNKGAYVPELLAMKIKKYRQLTEPPWKIIYSVEGEVVTIATIVDSRRNLHDFLLEKFIKPENEPL